jgi:hypothetical protein
VREETLKRFFQGEASASDLALDVAGSTEAVSPTTSRVAIEDMDSEFSVTRPMLASLTDAVLAGTLPPDSLGTIGFALQTSDKFVWDGDSDELVANVISDWSCPEINHPLTLENIAKFRAWLTGAEPYPARPRGTAGDCGRLVSIREKKSTNADRNLGPGGVGGSVNDRVCS